MRIATAGGTPLLHPYGMRPTGYPIFRQDGQTMAKMQFRETDYMKALAEEKRLKALRYAVNTLPERYREAVAYFLSSAEGRAANGFKIPICFIAGKQHDTVSNLFFCQDSAQPTIDASVALVRAKIRQNEQDYVISQMPVVTLPAMDREAALRRLEQYGRVAAYPGKVPVVYFQLETMDDLYLATVPLLPKGDSETHKMFGEVVWRVAHTGEGAYKRFGGLLLPRACAC
jgi:hypothetical protein